MILNHKDFKYDKKLLTIKKKQKYSQEFTFFPLKYDLKDFLIQIPVLFIPFGIQQYSVNDSKKYIDLSFQNLENDNNIQIFINNLKKIFSSIKKKFNDYSVEHFLKKTKYSFLLRLKLADTCLFFDQYKNKYNDELPKTYGSFIIQLSGLWLMNKKVWFNWRLLQAKINTPFILKEYAFIDDENYEENLNIKKFIPPPPPPPPPPPLPNKYSMMLKIGIPKHAVEQKKTLDRIRPEDLQSVQLKKGNNDNNNRNNIKKNTDNFTPSLDEIRNALQSLQKIK